jgi:uncharacterized membrane protein
MAKRGKTRRPALRRRKLPNWPLLGLSLTGMALTGYLSVVAWFGSKPLYCAAGSGCDVVQTSHWGTLLGLPIAFWGFLTHATLAYIAARVKRTELHWPYAWVVGLIGLGVSLYLTGVALFVIEAACAYCLASLALVATIVGVLVRQRPEELPGFHWPGWLAQTGGLTAAVLVLLHLQFSGVFHPSAGPEDPYLKALSIHLAKSDAKFYGAYWCDHCKQQKRLFGASASRLPYVECAPDGRNGPQARACSREAVDVYPTWVVDGRRYARVLKPRELARFSDFEWDTPTP